MRRTSLKVCFRRIRVGVFAKTRLDTRTYLVCIHPQFIQGSSQNMAKGKKSAVATAKPIVRNVEVKSSEANSSVKSRGDAERDYKIEPAKGKLGVMIPGMGPVPTTLVAGVGGGGKGTAPPGGSHT